MSKNIIEIKNLYKSFEKNNLKVLNNLNFTFKTGLTYSIVGPSGSGKSSLLNILSLIDRPSKGKVKINNNKIDFNDNKKNDLIRAQNVGIIYQDKNLLSDFTALENIFLARLTVIDDNKKAINDAKNLLKKLKLNKRSNHYPSELSGGENQRISILRALINSPKIILADEPSGNLDPKSSKDIFKLLLGLKDKDRVIIYATHNMHFAKMADCKLQIVNGKIKKYYAER